ncbi:arylacetamide deacetylase-like 3 isoform X2 [Hemicordylus capensis]|nr:arylacetamide deacetylase-like 3 isoform X2 [Hemicordylus capensis]XP_053137210.1 arylacetamide deacetylase-like 3 isoform X2 [Hemicordylus capensis]
MKLVQITAEVIAALLCNKRNLNIIDTKFDNVPVRIYQPKCPASGPRRGIIYFFGGGGLAATIKSYQIVCSHFARDSESTLVCIGQRLAPEYPYPAQLLDGIAGTEHFLKNASQYGVDLNRIIVAGDSSGATLAALVCQHLVAKPELPKVRAQMLFYPCLQGLDFNLPSYQQNQSIPFLYRKRSIKFLLQYMNVPNADVDGILKGAHVPEEVKAKYKKWIHADHIPDELKVRGYVPPPPVPFSKELFKSMEQLFEPQCCALLAEDAVLQELPETYILSCEFDILRDDSVLYKKRLEDNGVPVTWNHVTDAFHGILCAVNAPIPLPCAERAAKDIINFIKAI